MVLPGSLAVLLMAVVILVAAPASAGVNEWTSIGPYRVGARAIAIDPTDPRIIYVGTDYGDGNGEGSYIYKSTDGGASWVQLTQGLESRSYPALAIDPQTPSTVYAGSNGRGVFKSTDGGQTWFPSNTGATDERVMALAIDPQTPTNVYMASTDGVFKSTDAGVSWTHVVGDGYYLVACLAIDPISPQTVYAGTEVHGLLKSTDGGATWGQVGSFSDDYVWALAVDPSTPDTVFAGVAGEEPDEGVFKSTDAGATWQRTSLQISTRALAVDPSNPTTVYAGTARTADDEVGKIFKSPDGGATWLAVNTGLPPARASIWCLAVDPATPSTVYAGTWMQEATIAETGLFKTTDGGLQWTQTSLTAVIPTVMAMASGPQATLYVGSWYYDIFQTPDSGATWIPSAVHEEYGHPNPKYDLVVDPVTPTTIYVGTSDGLYKSADAGTSWAVLFGGQTRAIAIDPGDPTTIYLGGVDAFGSQEGVFKSTDGGVNWDLVHSMSSITGLVIDPQHPSVLFVASSNGGVFKSADGGGSWSPVNVGLPGNGVTALVIDPAVPTTLYAGVQDSGVFKTTDGGGNWFSVNNGLTETDIRCLAVDPASGSGVYAGTAQGGVFRSGDGGANWSEMNTNLPVGDVYSLLIDPTNPKRVFAGLYQIGVWTYQVVLLISTPAVLPAGIEGMAYSQALAATGGTEPYAWSITAGSLPPGLSLDAGTGEISGTPTAAGSYNFTVQVTDADSDMASKAFDLLIAEPLEITTDSPLPQGKRGVAYSQTVTATGGVLPYSWAITTGSLPAGVSLDAGTGVISGTPTDAGDFNFTVEVTDANAMTASKGFSMHVVDAPMVTTGPLPYGAVGIAYTTTLQAIGGVTPYTWTISAGSLPGGLTLGSTTGVISGTPTIDGDFSFTVQVTDAAAVTGVKTFDLTIVAEVAPVDLPVFAAADYDGDWKADIAVYRGSIGYWYIRNVGYSQWGGQPGDVPVPGDYDGDWKADLAVYRPGTGDWVIRNVGTFRWGIQAGDVPVPGDYDGDGYDDIAIYRPSNGYWYIRGVGNFRWGIQPGDVPVPADYNGDGKTDIAVYRPSNGYWYIRGVGNYRWGIQPGDVPVPGDYDGDGAADVAIYRPFNGRWYIRHIGVFKWGIQPGDIPVQADYDGDGAFDIAIYRPSSGYWYIRNVGNLRWGIQPGDMPVTRGNR